MADGDDDIDLATLDWDEVWRNNERALIRWARIVRAGLADAVETVSNTLFPPPPKLEDLLASFDLEDDHRRRTANVVWNSQTESAAAQKEKSDIDEVRAVAGPPENAEEAVAQAGLTAASNVLEKSANAPQNAVHVSDSAIVFENWHLTDIPETYVAPYSELLGNPSIVDKIKKARSMLEVIPHGTKGVLKPQPSGTMAWTRYDPKKTEGWMYVEPLNGIYGKWCQDEIKNRYKKAEAKALEKDADPSATAAEKMGARAGMRTLSAAFAVMRQEGLPSAINTYDGTVLTWCSGLAAQGKLKSIFYAISKDPNIRKAMYLCGFLYQGTPLDGVYQIVDVQKMSSVYYRTNYASEDARDPNDPNKIKYPKGTRDLADYKVLQKLVDQVELLYMLIMIARDPLTRGTVFDANLLAVEAMVALGSADKIATEALFVFIGEVRHNWAIGENMVEWARKRFTPAEAALPWPSEEHDRAVAKGVFRYVMRHVQRGAWDAAVAQLRVKAKKEGTKTPAGGIDFQKVMNNAVYSFDRLMESYWKPLQTGVGPKGFKPHSVDESTLEVSGFPAPAGSPPYRTDDVIIWSPKEKASYNIGSNAQCDVLFPSTNFKLVGFDESGNVLLQATDPSAARWTVTTKGKVVP